jgi:hypothetical protein
MEQALSLVKALPPCGGSVVSDVLSRLEVQGRGPGLTLLFRPTRAGRPLMIPSLLSAAVLVAASLTGLVVASAPPAHPVVLSGLTLPTIRERGPEEGEWRGFEGTVFLQTVVGPDGTVSSVRLLEGNPLAARPVVEGLLKDRFEPTRLRGRPVAVSVMRLVSRLDVWARTT